MIAGAKEMGAARAAPPETKKPRQP